jgi:hypothetical protein
MNQREFVENAADMRQAVGLRSILIRAIYPGCRPRLRFAAAGLTLGWNE